MYEPGIANNQISLSSFFLGLHPPVEGIKHSS